VLEVDDPGGGTFALFLRVHPVALRQLMCPHPREFAIFKKKCLFHLLVSEDPSNPPAPRSEGLCPEAFLAQRAIFG